MDNEEGSLIDTRFTPLWHIGIAVVAMIVLILISSSPIEIPPLGMKQPTLTEVIVIIILLITIWFTSPTPQETSVNGNQEVADNGS